MRAVARTDQSFNETFERSDTTNDGIPNRNVEEVYDAFYRADEDRASRVLDRNDEGNYTAMSIQIGTDGNADRSAATTAVDDGGSRRLTANSMRSEPGASSSRNNSTRGCRRR